MVEGILEQNEFEFCLERMPLVSVDICLVKSKRHVALVDRQKPPAEGVLFTPGGRIYKDEGYDEAIQRILKKELGITYYKNSAKFLNFFEHFYSDSAFSKRITTHYICLLFCLELPDDYEIDLNGIDSIDVGHEEVKWIDIEVDFTNANIHDYAIQNLNCLRKWLK